MANKRSDYQDRESTWSGKSGDRERSSTSRTSSDSDIGSEEMRSQGRTSDSSKRTDDMSYSDVRGDRRGSGRMNPDLEEDSGFQGQSGQSGLGDKSRHPGNKGHNRHDLEE